MSDEPAKLSLKLRPAPIGGADSATASPAEAAPTAVAPSVAAANPAPKQVQKIALGIGLGGLIVFVGIGFIAYPRLMAETRAITEAQQRMQAEEEAEMRAARAERLAAENEQSAPAPAAPSHATPASTPAPQATVASPPSPVVAPAPAVAADGDAAFRTWVSDAKIGGVREGRVVRILIGHSAYTLGDIVDPALGIRFDSYDAGTHTVRFRDDAGHTMERRDW